MAEELEFEGKKYISSKRAADLSGYAQDYIGQLSRKNLIDARRVGGLWYVFWDSLQAYQTKAEAYIPEPPPHIDNASDSEAFISFAGKNYVSAARAAKSTGYHQDYVGQLARSGKLLSRRIGNRWYVDHQALLEHKKEKDALLGAVQSRSVGVATVRASGAGYELDEEPFFTYRTDGVNDLLPLNRSDIGEVNGNRDMWNNSQRYDTKNQIPIRIIGEKKGNITFGEKRNEKYRVAIHGKSMFYGTFAVLTLSVVIVLSIGFVVLKSSSLYAFSLPGVGQRQSGTALTGMAIGVLSATAESLERLLAQELTYVRSQ